MVRGFREKHSTAQHSTASRGRDGGPKKGHDVMWWKKEFSKEKKGAVRCAVGGDFCLKTSFLTSHFTRDFYACSGGNDNTGSPVPDIFFCIINSVR